MPKTIILDDETYNKLKKKAREEDRSMSKMAKILFDRALAAAAAPTPIAQFAPQQYNSMPEMYVQGGGTVFNESTHFATVDDVIGFYAKSSKPIHLVDSDTALRLHDLIEYSDEMMHLRKEHERLESEIDEDGSDWQKLAMEQQEIKTKIRALVDKADNFMDNYQGLTA